MIRAGVIGAPRLVGSEPLCEQLDRLHWAAWALCGSPHDAEDLVQETLVRVLARPRRLRRGSEPAYLTAALRNTFLHSLRTAGRRPRTVDPLMCPSARKESMSMARTNDDIPAREAPQKRSTARSSPYLLAGQASELERLHLQSLVWEPSGRRLLEEVGNGRGARALDVGCGALGWLRVLSEWVGPDGEVTGTDIDESMLSAANRFVTDEWLRNVGLANDDLFATELEPDSFDLVHARAVICPLGRAHEQMETYVRLARSGGTIVLEDPDWDSWHFNPPAPALERLIALIEAAFLAGGGDWKAGRNHLHLLREFSIQGNVRAEVVALSPGDPYGDGPPDAIFRDLDRWRQAMRRRRALALHGAARRCRAPRAMPRSPGARCAHPLRRRAPQRAARVR